MNKDGTDQTRLTQFIEMKMKKNRKTENENNRSNEPYCQNRQNWQIHRRPMNQMHQFSLMAVTLR